MRVVIVSRHSVSALDAGEFNTARGLVRFQIGTFIKLIATNIVKGKRSSNCMTYLVQCFLDCLDLVTLLFSKTVNGA
jgi:hypothetical protein